MNKLEIFHGKFSIILITICFIFLTNTYFDYDESILYGAADILYYHQIALSAPELPDKIIEYHYAQRFFVPYTIGIISNKFNLEIIYFARFFVNLLRNVYWFIFRNCFGFSSEEICAIYDCTKFGISCRI